MVDRDSNLTPDKVGAAQAVGGPPPPMGDLPQQLYGNPEQENGHQGLVGMNHDLPYQQQGYGHLNEEAHHAKHNWRNWDNPP